MKQLLVCAAIAAAAIGRAGPPTSAQSSRYGMHLIDLDRPVAEKMLELGAGRVRLAFGWDVIEGACRGCFDWTTTDRWRDEARRSGLTIFATIGYTPQWANGGRSYQNPPLDYQDWYNFVYAAASRYKDDIFEWGIWNEPNLDVFLAGADLETYRVLATTAHAAVKAANPRARVLGPEVSWHALTSGWYASAMRSVGDLFDIVTVHWYVDAPALDFLMDQLVRPFSQGKPVWLSEVGMKPCATIYGEAGQALVYQRVLDAMGPRREWWTGVFFYTLYERPAPFDCGSAITRPDFSNRPAFTLLQRYIRANP